MFKKTVLIFAIFASIVTTQPAQASNHSKTLSNLGMNEIMFAQGMIPHHEQALVLAKLALKNSSSAPIKELAASIIKGQSKEIAQMKYWLKATNSSMDMGHDMGMNGMLDDDQMRALEAASGAEFDRLYLQGMIEHHKGAIQMAQMVINSSNAEAKVLGTAIVDSQSKQIQYMESLLSK